MPFDPPAPNAPLLPSQPVAADLSQWMTDMLRHADSTFGIEPAAEIARFLAAQSLRS